MFLNVSHSEYQVTLKLLYHVTLFFQVFTFVVSVSSFIRVVNQQQQQCEKPVCPSFETRSCNGSPAAAGTSHGGMKSFFVVFFFVPSDRQWCVAERTGVVSKDI